MLFAHRCTGVIVKYGSDSDVRPAAHIGSGLFNKGYHVRSIFYARISAIVQYLRFKVLMATLILVILGPQGLHHNRQQRLPRLHRPHSAGATAGNTRAGKCRQGRQAHAHARTWRCWTRLATTAFHGVVCCCTACRRWHACLCWHAILRHQQLLAVVRCWYRIGILSIRTGHNNRGKYSNVQDSVTLSYRTALQCSMSWMELLMLVRNAILVQRTF